LLLLSALLMLLGAQTFLSGLLGEMIIVPRMQSTAGYHVSEAVTPGVGMVKGESGWTPERVEQSVGPRDYGPAEG
jgi:hypothetical protein